MFREYIQALFKRADARQLGQFRPPSLPARIYTKQINIDSKHYAAFCQQTHWQQQEQIHPLYLQVLSLPLQIQCLLDKKSPFPLLGLIHCANKVTLHGTCDLATSFECRVKFSDVRPHSRGWEFDITLFAFQHGQCVYEATSSYLLKVKAVHVAPKPVPVQASEACQQETQQDIASLEASADTGRRYAKLSGDFNPIHLYPITAKLFGFKRPIAHGMWTLARTVSMVMENESKPLRQLTCQFKRPIYLPAKVQLVKSSESDTAVTVDVINSERTQNHLKVQVEF